MIDDGTRAWAQRPGAQRVLGEARRRAERGQLRATGSLVVALNDDERRDVGLLLGSEWQISARRVSIENLRKRLTTRGVHLEDLLVALGGPIDDRVVARAAAVESRRLEEAAAASVLGAAIDRLCGPESGLLERVVADILPSSGTGRRLSRAGALAQLLDGLDHRNGPNGVSLAVLAAETFGDAHALDQSTPLGRAAARLVGALGAGRAGATSSDLGSPDVGTSEGWRLAWWSVGVVCDRVSSTVLVLNLPLVGSPALMTLSGVMGEPVWLTARILAGGVEAAAALGPVFVCENPSVVETAADRMGAGSRPLLCTFGRPSLAAITVLRALHAAGVEVRVSADDDRGGELVRAAVLTACPNALDWIAAGGGTFEEERIEGMLADLG
ncbi:TIGR02679 domain-containing protein [Lapillicoccus sp.]|uniref:TIGR02679 domain-containing protein n=1 Tax=Lapillicoccus sp. TaxID=1909287 RepID=UPI0025DB52E5|nr:TIGR02679 domain-containing protein [Lapillicoccus sp.]